VFKKKKIIPYNPDLKDLARKLRKNMTLSEVLLWNELKNNLDNVLMVIQDWKIKTQPTPGPSQEGSLK